MANGERQLMLVVEEETVQGPRAQRHARMRNWFINIILGLANRVHSGLNPEDHNQVTQDIQEEGRDKQGLYP